MSHVRRGNIGTCCMVWAALGLTSSSWGQVTLVVDKLDASCDDATGSPAYCTIQAAIDDSADGDTIDIRAGTYTENLTVDTSLTLMGADADTTIIDGSASGRVIEVSAAETLHIDISALTLRNGTSTSGGALRNDLATVTLRDCVIRENVGDGGSAIYNNSFGTMTLEGCVVELNDDTAVVNVGTMHLLDCTFRDNTGGSLGGGIRSSGVLTAERCTFAGNEVSARAGGLHNNDGTATLTDCTFSGNTANNDQGGGIANDGSAATMQLIHCTVVNNVGLGVANINGASLIVANSIFADNVLTSASPSNCMNSGTITSQGFNIEDRDDCELTAASDQPDTDPMLSALQDNGGPTLTHAPQNGSPVIDGVTDSSACTSTGDQRGFARPMDGDGDGGAECDIGAVEYVDCDSNGVDDGTDIAEGSSADADSDNVPDASGCDNCVGVFNPDQGDCDGDGVGDPCEGAVPERDADKDGVCNGPDNCPGAPNPDQGDCDSDSTGDACEANPAERDDDMDGVCNGVDTCTDLDGDGFGATGTDQSGCAETGDDCDDSDDGIFPGATDACGDGVDQDCDAIDGSAPDADGDEVGDTCDDCVDVDGDLSGDGTNGNTGCPFGTLTDCDDTDDTISPRVGDDCDSVDNNCDGVLGLLPDTDSDGIGDGCDDCTDTDGDGFGDPGFPGNTCTEDGCPSDAAKSTAGACGCGTPDADSDGDGTADCSDACPSDAGKVDQGACGCGVADADADGDGFLDCVDNCPTEPNSDQADGNGDGVGDACSGADAAVPPCGAVAVTLTGLWTLLACRLTHRRRLRRRTQ